MEMEMNMSIEQPRQLQQQKGNFIKLDDDYVNSIKLLRNRQKAKQMDVDEQQKLQDEQKQEIIKIGNTDFYFRKLLEATSFVPEFIKMFFSGKNKDLIIDENQDNTIENKWSQNFKLIKNVYFPKISYTVNSKRHTQFQGHFMFKPMIQIGFLNLKQLTIHQHEHDSTTEENAIVPILSLQSISLLNMPNIQQIKIFLVNIVSLKPLQKTNFKYLSALINSNEKELQQNYDANMFKIRFYNKNRIQAIQDTLNYQINLNTVDISSLAKFELTKVNKLASKTQIRYFKTRKTRRNIPTHYHKILSQKYPRIQINRILQKHRSGRFEYGDFIPHQRQRQDLRNQNDLQYLGRNRLFAGRQHLLFNHGDWHFSDEQEQQQRNLQNPDNNLPNPRIMYRRHIINEFNQQNNHYNFHLNHYINNNIREQQQRIRQDEQNEFNQQPRRRQRQVLQNNQLRQQLQSSSQQSQSQLNQLQL